MRFCDVSEVPEKPVFTRLFDLFASAVLANFQDRLVMTASWLIGASRYNPTNELVPAYSTTPVHICQENKSKKAATSDSLLITDG